MIRYYKPYSKFPRFPNISLHEKDKKNVEVFSALFKILDLILVLPFLYTEEQTKLEMYLRWLQHQKSDIIQLGT